MGYSIVGSDILKVLALLPFRFETVEDFDGDADVFAAAAEDDVGFVVAVEVGAAGGDEIVAWWRGRA